MDFLCCIIFEGEKLTYSWDDDKKNTSFTTLWLTKEFGNELLIRLYSPHFAKNDFLHVSLVHHLHNNCAADEFGCTRSIIGLYRLRFANDSLHNPKPFSSSSIELILVSAH